MRRKSEIEAIAISIPMAARALGVCPKTVSNEIRDGRLVTARVRGRRVVPVEALRAYIRRGQKTEAAASRT